MEHLPLESEAVHGTDKSKHGQNPSVFVFVFGGLNQAPHRGRLSEMAVQAMEDSPAIALAQILAQEETGQPPDLFTSWGKVFVCLTPGSPE